MENTGYLQWGPSLETEISIIDEQHKMLVEMCNQANRKLQDRIDKEFVEQIVHDLMSYALYHFETEEELMLEYDYSEKSAEAAARHIAEHRSFSETVAGVKLALVKGELISRENLMGFLNGWLVNHIMNTDMQLAKFLHEAR